MTLFEDVGHYYDELHRWTVKDRDFQVFSGLQNDTIHRFLSDPDNGTFSPDTIYRFIDPLIAQCIPVRGLDAGCGYGGTCFRSVAVHGGHWTGITISPEQQICAATLARARGLEAMVDFRLQSYDAPIEGRFNVMIGIESLIHAADPGHTIANLAAALDSRGRLIIVDDMPVEAVPARDAEVLAQFKRLWRCPVVPSADSWIDLAGKAGLRLMHLRDLSPLMRPREETDLDAAFAAISASAGEKAGTGFARIPDAELGGLNLERLYRRGSMRYVLMVFER